MFMIFGQCLPQYFVRRVMLSNIVSDVTSSWSVIHTLLNNSLVSSGVAYTTFVRHSYLNPLRMLTYGLEVYFPRFV